MSDSASQPVSEDESPALEKLETTSTDSRLLLKLLRGHTWDAENTVQIQVLLPWLPELPLGRTVSGREQPSL